MRIFLRSRYGLLAVLLLALPTWASSAQSPVETSPFASCVEATGGNATIIIPETAELSVDGEAFSEGDELAVIDAAGQCVGHLTWSGTGSEALVVWEAGLFSESTAGLRPGDPLTLRVWQRRTDRVFTPANSSVEVVLDTSTSHLNETFHYQRDGIYVVRQLTVHSSSDS